MANFFFILEGGRTPPPASRHVAIIFSKGKGKSDNQGRGAKLQFSMKIYIFAPNFHGQEGANLAPPGFSG